MSGYIGTQPVPQATQTRDSFTATSGQTSFATSGYTPNFLDVFLNGVKLAAADYTATNGSDVVLASGAVVNDILEVVAYTAFDTANVTGATNFTVTGAFTSQGIDDNANATALTIDSSENVMVGSTNNSPATNNVAGSSHGSLGNIQASVDGNPCLFVNRKSNDGDIISLRKDGSAVGSIGVIDGNNTFLQGATGHGGIAFATNNVVPFREDAYRDNTLDLGQSNVRWKDLYISGGVYLGGTGSANKLTDYEQGTWTPVDSGGNAYNQAVTATYVKIGKLVYIYMDITSTSSTVANNTNQVAGLPFTSGTSSNAGTISQGYNTGSGNVTGHMYGSSIYLVNGQSTAIVLNQRLMASGVYHTDQ